MAFPASTGKQATGRRIPAVATIDRAEAATPDLSVIVVTHNRPELALATLRAARVAATELCVEWLVVDSGSTDSTPDAIERAWPDIRVQRLRNVGFAAANNRALALARGRYVLLLNPDCVIAAGTFRELVAALDASPRIGVASVIQRGPSGELLYSIRRYPSPRLALGEALGAARVAALGGWREEETRRGRYLSAQSVDWLVGAFLIARAAAIRDVGGLDERFFLYSEETDWCYRIRCAGWEVCHLPVMSVTHHSAPEYQADLLAQLSYAKLLFSLKNYRPRRSAAMRRALALRHLLRAAAASALSRRDPSWAGRAAAERRALAVVRGRATPPFGRPPAGGRTQVSRSPR